MHLQGHERNIRELIAYLPARIRGLHRHSWQLDSIKNAYYIFLVRFEWDRQTAEANLRKHGDWAVIRSARKAGPHERQRYEEGD